MEVASSSETLVSINHITVCNIPEERNLLVVLNYCITMERDRSVYTSYSTAREVAEEARRSYISLRAILPSSAAQAGERKRSCILLNILGSELIARVLFSYCNRNSLSTCF
jgi:hypothetical protein